MDGRGGRGYHGEGVVDMLGGCGCVHQMALSRCPHDT